MSSKKVHLYGEKNLALCGREEVPMTYARIEVTCPACLKQNEEHVEGRNKENAIKANRQRLVGLRDFYPTGSYMDGLIERSIDELEQGGLSDASKVEIEKLQETQPGSSAARLLKALL